MMITLVIGVREDEETGLWISHSPELNLYSQGTTEKEACDALEEGIRTHVALCNERNLLFDVLKDVEVTLLDRSIENEEVDRYRGRYNNTCSTTLQFAAV